VWNSLIERSGKSNLTYMKFTVFAENLEWSDFEFFNGIGQERAFAGAPKQVGHRGLTRRSGSAVGYPPDCAPSNVRNRAHAWCRKRTLAS
jgi:hypothetical protein